jgi:radical SAM superfamily enzyme YgiQ (UPF0313 family)
MPDIVLATLNAKYIHAAFGLRYLLANLGPLRPSAALVEFDIHQRPIDIAEVLLARQPKIIGLGVYIWNVAPTTEVVTALKRVRPDVTIILGGPEVSYEVEQQEIVKHADYVVTGEADLKFAEVCRQLLSGQRPADKVISAPLPEFSQLELPYDFYTDEDLSHRVVYVEASRGCPFTCEFCLSSLDIPVRQAPLATLFWHLQRLLDRGVKQFKFVDRTFNLNLHVSRAILEFCLARYQPGHFFHFEMVPDRLPDALRQLIAQFPPGALQLEVGIQTFNEDVAKNIRRRQNYEKLADNLRFLRQHTGVHVHADLIMGLPGETVASFAEGFDRLIALGPQEIQVGMLKRLRGTPIIRHDAEWQMIYNPHPPYEILQTRLIDFALMQRLRRFARYWDLVGNSGNFVETTPLIWSEASPAAHPSTGPETFGPRHDGDSVVGSGPSETGGKPVLLSPFDAFLRWSDWLYERVKRADGIALARLAGLLFAYLTGERGLAPTLVAEPLWRDWQRGGRCDAPEFLRPYLPGTPRRTTPLAQSLSLKRQARHRGMGRSADAPQQLL